MRANLKTIYGLIMISDLRTAQEIYRAINPEWNSTLFYERLYKCFGEILEQNKDVDPISVINYFRAQGVNDKGIALKISNLTKEVPNGAHLMINSILGEVEYFFQINKAKIAASKINELIDSDNFTNDKLNEILDAAKPIQAINLERSNIETIFDIVNDHNRTKNGELPGIDLGWSTFHNEIILEDVDVMVVGARPAMGKTAFAVSLAINQAFKRERHVVFFSLEMSKKQIMRRIIANLSAIDSNRIKYGECSDAEIKRIYSIQGEDALSNIHIYEGSRTINDISIILSDLKREGKADIVIIDYLQKILPKSKGSRYEQVTEVSNGVKRISQNMKIPCVALAQLSRDSAKIGKLPTLTDLKESGEIEQDASIVAFLHRPEYYGEEITSNGNNAENVAEILVAKNREGSVGKFEMGVNLSLSKFHAI
jgi:replicative DNA helicase